MNEKKKPPKSQQHKGTHGESTSKNWHEPEGEEEGVKRRYKASWLERQERAAVSQTLLANSPGFVLLFFCFFVYLYFMGPTVSNLYSM